MIYPYILTLSILTWGIIPFRQFKKKFFIFFLILALMDPIIITAFLLFHVDPLRIYVPLVLLSIYSLFEVKTIKKNIFLFILIIASSLVFSFLGNNELLRICLMFLILVTFIIFFKFALIELYKEEHINIFYFVLCVYEISLLLKFMLEIINIKTGAIFFILSLLFEVFIGTYFIIYNEVTSPKIKLKLSSEKML